MNYNKLHCLYTNQQENCGSHPYADIYLQFMKYIRGNKTGIIKNYVELNEIKFSVVGHTNMYGRHLIKYISEYNSIKKNLMGYTSKSQGGYWRLCIKGIGGIYQKGYDYVNSTLISFELQDYINKKYKYSEDLILLEKEICEFNKNDGSIIYDYINNTNRSVVIEVLKPLAYCKPGHCFNNIMPLKNLIMDLPFNCDYCMEFKQLLQNIPEEMDYTNQLKKIVNCVSSYMEKYFKNDGMKSLIYKFTTNDENLNIEMNIAVYTTIITNKDSNINYTLYYQEINYNNLKNKKYDGYYYIPLIILPPETKIDIFGLYSQFVSCGIYASKILEYTKQLSFISPNDRLIYDKNNTSEYTFIGDIITNMWPLKYTSYK